MLRPDVYIAAVSDAVEHTAAAAEGHLEAVVEHCPGFDVNGLLQHTGGFCRIVAGRVASDEEWVPNTGTWHKAPPEEVDGDPVLWHRRWGTTLLDALAQSAATEPVGTWAGQRTRYFWYRRAAHELSIHRWDAQHACGVADPIPAAIAIDGIDEFLGEFGARAAQLLTGAGETYQFIVEDVGASFTVTAEGERLQNYSHVKPDVTARATADVLIRFLWGRALPADLEARGDVDLLRQWHDLVRI